jgi:hypothetical protein
LAENSREYGELADLAQRTPGFFVVEEPEDCVDPSVSYR